MQWLRIKEWFHRGTERLRWLASLLTERLHIELAVIKLLGTVEDLRRRRDEAVRRLGERVLQLKESPAHDVFTDQEVKQIFKEIEELDEEMEAARSRADELSRLED